MTMGPHWGLAQRPVENERAEAICRERGKKTLGAVEVARQWTAWTQFPISTGSSQLPVTPGPGHPMPCSGALMGPYPHPQMIKNKIFELKERERSMGFSPLFEQLGFLRCPPASPHPQPWLIYSTSCPTRGSGEQHQVQRQPAEPW